MAKPFKYDPNFARFYLDPDVRVRLQKYMVNSGFGIRNQSKAITSLVDKALTAEGY